MFSQTVMRWLIPVARNSSRSASVFCVTNTHPGQSVFSPNFTTTLNCWRSIKTNSTTVVEPQIINIQDAQDFQKRVIEASTDSPILVDFHASWCGPCKLLNPRLENIIAEENGKIIMAKVDVDELVEIAMKYNVRSIPALFGIKDGRIIKSLHGLKETDELKKFIEELKIEDSKDDKITESKDELKETIKKEEANP